MKLHYDHPTLEALHGMLCKAISDHRVTDDNDDDTLVMAVLGRIRQRLYVRLGKCQFSYQLHLEADEALALRIWVTEWQPAPPTPYMHTQLQLLSDTAHRFTHQ